MSHSDKQSYEGIRTFFFVPTGIGVFLIILSIAGVLAVAGDLMDAQVFVRREARGFAILSLVPAGLGLLAFWVANKTYVRRLVFDDQKIVVYRMWGKPKVYSWSDVVRAYGSDTAVCLEFAGQKNLELNSCLQNFRAAREGLLDVYKVARESKNR